jgi:hypothetical protein
MARLFTLMTILASSLAFGIPTLAATANINSAHLKLTCVGQSKTHSSFLGDRYGIESLESFRVGSTTYKYAAGTDDFTYTIDASSSCPGAGLVDVVAYDRTLTAGTLERRGCQPILAHTGPMRTNKDLERLSSSQSARAEGFDFTDGNGSYVVYCTVSAM